MQILFENMSDEDICEKIKNGDSKGMDFLLDKYKELVRKKARSYYLIGGDTDDLIQEGMIGLMYAIRNYSKGKSTSFAGFADICINRRLYSAVRTSQREKNSPLNSYVSLYQPAADEENAPALMDTLAEDGADPQEMMVSREQMELRLHRLYHQLSAFEQDVLRLYMDGESYAGIAARLGKEKKAVDNALSRVRAKAAESFEKSGT